MTSLDIIERGVTTNIKLHSQLQEVRKRQDKKEVREMFNQCARPSAQEKGEMWTSALV
jgi:hypothetical protein